MLGAGMLFAGGATFAYKRKQTTAFKLLYFASWPTLGSALMYALIPSPKDMEKVSLLLLLLLLWIILLGPWHSESLAWRPCVLAPTRL